MIRGPTPPERLCFVSVFFLEGWGFSFVGFLGVFGMSFRGFGRVWGGISAGFFGDFW